MRLSKEVVGGLRGQLTLLYGTYIILHSFQKEKIGKVANVFSTSFALWHLNEKPGFGLKGPFHQRQLVVNPIEKYLQETAIQVFFQMTRSCAS